MTVADLIASLREKGVELRANQDQLALSAPKDVMTAELRSALAARKDEILTYLRAQEAQPGASEHVLARRPHNGTIPQSFAQQRLWYIDQLEPFSSTYNMTPTFAFEGPLDAAALERAVDEVYQRHDALRTRLDERKGTPVQIIDTGVTLPLERVDLRDLEQSAADDEVRAQTSARANEPFDLAGGTLIRVTLYELPQDRFVLAFVIHHAVFDGWSLSVLLRELSALYAAHARDEAPNLPALPVQYADYSGWQRDWFSGPDFERQRDYWLTQLRGDLPTLGFPTDKPRPRLQSYRGVALDWRCPARLAKAAHALARQERSTSFMVLLAAFKLALFRYTGQEDVIVGSPFAGRNAKELEGLIGLFANTLVLRTDLGGNPSFRRLLGRVREVCIGAYGHEDMPFERLVEELQPERDMSRTPLFQAMFALEEAGIRRANLGSMALQPYDVSHVVARTDLSLWLRPADDGIGFEGTLEYCTDLFEEDRMRCFLGHFERLLERALEDPDRSIEELPLLDDDERERLVSGWNQTDRIYDEDATVNDLFTAAVERFPHRTAVSCAGRELTYRELDERAERFAVRLRAMGVGAGDHVGICLERSEVMLVAVLGILRSGAAYVPLDPSYPHERLRFMVKDSGARVVLSEAELASVAGSVAEELLLVDSPEEPRQVMGETPSRATEDPSGDSRAYVIYTSGSTGTPKGVAVTHRCVVNFLLAMANEPGITAEDRLLAVTTLSFDISVLELLLPLCVGAQVVIADSNAVADARELRDEIDRSAITMMQATPSTWRMLFDVGWEGSPGLTVLCGGEPFPRDLAGRLLESVGSVWNMYGPTETTVWSACHRLQASAGNIPVGRPIANTRIYVLDQYRAPVPIGVPGEIYIGGAGVTEGYLNRDELTADAFVTLDLGRGSERVYRTGDIGRHRQDGALDCIGRIDSQVKLRGFRIELGEVEASVSGHPGVHQAVAAVREDRPGDCRLVVYVVRERGTEPESTEIREHVRAHLPAHMVPQHIVMLESIPLTQNGKVNRAALPAPSTANDAAGAGRAPSTIREKLLAGIWSEALDVDQIGVDDNFFDLGGHSLLAMRVIHLIEEETGHRLTPMQISLQTLGQLAAASESPERADESRTASRSLGKRVASALRSAVSGN